MERYNRNILIPQITEEGQKALLGSRVLIAGAGGLGSTVIANLASVGVGNIGIIDNDKLELSNLNRQYIHKFANIGQLKVDSAKEWVLQFNPEINIEIYPIRLDNASSAGIIQPYDIVIDCFDSFKSKFLLNKLCVKYNKPLIHGGVTEFYGQAMVIIPGETACLECVFPDFDVDSYVLKGVISPAVSTIASIQSMEAVKQLLGIGEPLVNNFLSYNGLSQEYRKIKINKNPECSVC